MALDPMAGDIGEAGSAKDATEEETIMLRRRYPSALPRFAGNAVLGLALLGALVSSGTAAAAGGTVKLGIVTFLSGPAAGPFGIPSKDAATVVIDAINAGTLLAPYHSKGLGGATIEPVFIDETGSPTQVVENFRNLVQQRHVDAVVGYVSSGSCLAVAPVAEELKALTVFFDCGTPRIFEDHSYHYVFRTAATATMDNTGAARYLKKEYPQATSYAGINQNYAWGQDSWRDFTASMKVIEPGSKVTGVLWPKLFSGQYGAEISTLLIEKPAIIHSSLWGGDLSAFFTQAAARNLTTHSRLVLTTGETHMFTFAQHIPDGSILGARGPYGVYAHKTALNHWFRAAYEKRFGTPPIYPSYQMAQALLGLKAAYDKAEKKVRKTPATQAVIAAFAHLKFVGFGDTVDMALGNGHQAVTEMALGTFEYDAKAQKAKMVKVVYFPAWCVNPPPGEKAAEWIAGGFKGAKCR
jgi:branched-chain amino acid transport system substrate-binding protein